MLHLIVQPLQTKQALQDISTYTDPTDEDDTFTGVFGFTQTAAAQKKFGLPAFECHSTESKCLAAYTSADSKGSEMVSWLSEDYFSDYFVLTDALFYFLRCFPSKRLFAP